MSQRAYARRVGVSHVAVQKAIASGRLSASVVNGKIVDPELADSEWAAATDLSRAPPDVRERAGRRAEPPPGELAPEMEEVFATDGLPSAVVGMSLTEASAIEKVWRAKLAELKFRKEAAELIPAAQMQRVVEGTFQSCKTKLLAIPHRARQQLPHLSGPDVVVIEGLLREALEALSEAPTA